MKFRRALVCLGIAGSIALVIAACTIIPKEGQRVSIYHTFVEIYPGTKISSDDQKALDGVLKNFDKSLYKIQTYDHGKLVKTQGSLADVQIGKALVSEVNKASQNGVSDLTVVVGVPNRGGTPQWPWPPQTPNRAAHGPAIGPHRPAHGPIGPHLPPHLGPATKKEYLDSVRLVSFVTPILEKYSVATSPTAATQGRQSR